MSSSLSRKLAVTAVVVAAAAAGSFAYGALKDTGVVHACYAHPGGQLRLGTTCKKTERPVSWGIAGPQGPAGPQGGAGPQGPAGAAGASLQVLGSSDAGCQSPAGAQTYFLGLFGGCEDAVETTNELPLPAGGTAKNFYAYFSPAPGSGNSVTFTLRKNAASTSVTCTISGSSTTCSDTSNTAQYGGGDLISVQVTQTAGVAANGDFGWTSQYVG